MPYAVLSACIADVLTVDIHTDYYALLHVQPSAPGPVIKASYRAMMQKLKHHPDKGGDVEFAQLLNDAAKTLCNPDTRAQYDALRAQISLTQKSAKQAGSRQTDSKQADQKKETDKASASQHESTQRAWGEPGGSPQGEDQAEQKNNHSYPTHVPPAQLADTQQCPFCHSLYASCQAVEAGANLSQFAYASSRRCSKCNGAKTPITQACLSNDDELRRLHRQSLRSSAQLWLSWPQAQSSVATITDFSPVGCAMQTTMPLTNGKLVLIETSLFNAICVVRHCNQTANEQWTSGLSFITLDLHSSPGTLLNATA